MDAGAKAPAEQALKSADLRLGSGTTEGRVTGLIWMAVAVLTAMLIALTAGVLRDDPAAWAAAAPEEGYTWAVAQYEIAFLKLRAELSAEAAGKPVSVAAHKKWAAILAERADALGRSTSSLDFYQRLPGFAEVSAELERFQKRITVVLAKEDFSRVDATAALVDFELLDPTLDKLDHEIKDEQSRRRKETLNSLAARRQLSLWLTIAAWAVFAGLVAALTLAALRQRQTRVAQARALDAERQSVESMQQALKAKGEFLAAISHELRSPLQTIRSALDLLELRAVGEDQAALITRVQRATKVLSTQLRDLLTLAQGEAGKLEVQPERFDACELVEEIGAQYRDAAHAKGLVLRVRLPRDLVLVVADPIRVLQVLTNLVSNAVKYTATGQVQLVLHPFDRRRGMLRFEVRDTGPGIPDALLPTLFSPFRRLAALDRTSESVGIGLAVVKSLVDTLGGSISVDSRDGEGTRFCVDIPATELLDEVAEALPSGAARVLLVDDRADVLEALASVTLELGYVVDTAGSAAVAANKLAAEAYDVVLVDLDMPGKSGKQLTSEVRRGKGPNRRVPMLAMSAAEGRSVGDAWPFNGFLAKPIDRRALRRSIEEALDARAHVSADGATAKAPSH